MMSDVNLLPVGTGDSGWGTGGAAALGAFVGSWFGNGWGGNGYGRGDVVVPAAAAVGAVDNVGLTLLQGQNQTNLAIASASADVYTSLNNTMTQQLLASQSQSASLQSTLCQGFSGVNQSVYQAGVDTRFAINDLARQNAECCCEIKTTIAAEGAATRQLIQNNLITELQTQLCDSKAKNAQLENQIFLQTSQAAQTQQIISTVLAHLPQK